ncbi:MAG: phage tail tube protein [Candidatus Babeliales bacterium]|jgi:hypothetical protein
MSSTTGKSWVLGTYVTTVFTDLGGKPFDVRIQRHSTTTKEAGTGQRKLASIDSSGVYYTIDFKLKITALATFINVNCFVTAEGTLPSFSLYTDDGTTKRGFTTCYVNTCSIDGGQTGALTASIQVIAIANEDKTLTGTLPTLAPMTKAAVTTLSIGGTTITKWTKWNFSVNNNVKVLATGNGVAMTEIWAQQAEYSGSFTFVKTASLTYGYAADVAKDLIFTLVNNAVAPVTTTYTFDDVRASSNEYYVSELDITYESVTWDGDELAIT